MSLLRLAVGTVVVLAAVVLAVAADELNREYLEKTWRLT